MSRVRGGAIAALTAFVIVMSAGGGASGQSGGLDSLAACTKPPPELVVTRNLGVTGPFGSLRAAYRDSFVLSTAGGLALDRYGDVRLTVPEPAWLFATYRTTGVRSLEGRPSAFIVSPSPGPVGLKVEWTDADETGANRCRQTQTVSIPVTPACHAQLARPDVFVTADGNTSGRGANAISDSSLRFRFTGCPGAPLTTATYDVRAYAVAGSRTPPMRGRVSRARAFDALALDPISGQALDRTKSSRRLQRSEYLGNPLVAVALERFGDDERAERIDSLVITLDPPGAGLPHAGKSMSVLVVAHDAAGRPTGPRWLVKARPTGRKQRRAPQDFVATVKRIG